MKKFTIIADVTISVYTVVEAETLEDAIEIAKDRDLMPIIQDGSYKAEDTLMTDELDGMPTNFREE
jgi:hypothetical protein